jgi:cysteinyl-tRNA synthetase
MAKPNEPKWPSPWGDGRPGWHIECSAMSTHFIDDHFDIHGGGMDLTFPHHENEIAQSEGATGCKFVNTWMHVGFVNINDEKMSKSLNNFFTIRDILEKYDGETLRYFLISSHYRSPLNFSSTNIDSAKSALKRLYTATRGLSDNVSINYVSNNNLDYEDRFNSALNDDFNTPIAISILFEIAKQINVERLNDLKKANALSQLLKKLANFLGILEYDADEYLKQGSELSENEILDKISKREQARLSKDFAMSDQVRDELLEFGIILEDTADGTTWRRR